MKKYNTLFGFDISLFPSIKYEFTTEYQMAMQKSTFNIASAADDCRIHTTAYSGLDHQLNFKIIIHILYMHYLRCYYKNSVLN